MFYSQIILAKKGPLGKVWMAAHWGDKKLGRPQIFSTDISKSVDYIVQPAVPLALRVSSHLLLGVVRIYSRQVQYVLTDCHEAMIKLKLAFAKSNAHTSNDTKKNVDLEPNKRATDGHLNVANFGDYQLLEPHSAILPFAIPFDLHNLQQQAGEQWVLAEEQQPLEKQADWTAHEQEEQDEQWTAFDPDADEDRHIFDDTLDSKDVSDVELVRGAADASLDSAALTNTLARTSILNDDHKASSPNVVPQPDEDDDMLPFDDDGDDDRPLPPADEESLGLLDDADSSIPTRRNSSMGGLNEDTRSLGPSPKQKHKKRASVTGPKRMRKRRKIVIDNDSTELSNDHIRNMLKNTSDIVLANLRHPSDWTSDDEKKKEDERPSRLVDLRSVLPPAKLLARPHLGDDGTLAPALLEVWYRNTAPLLGKPTPFRMRGAQHVMDQAAHAEEVEIGRQGQQRDSTDHDVATPPFDEDGSDMPLPQDDEEEDMVVPFDDADDEPPAHEGGEGFATEEAMSSPLGAIKGAARRKEESEISRPEIALADGTAGEHPKTVNYYERLLRKEPNRSKHWVDYMHYHLSLGDSIAHIESARRVAQRAFDRIEFRQEDEKLNVWTALMILELQYGSVKRLQETVDQACQHTNPKKVYLRICQLLKKVINQSSYCGDSRHATARADALKSILKKWNRIEEEHGTEASQEHVKDVARAYVEGLSSADENPVISKQTVALNLYQRESRTLLQRCMLLAGYAPSETTEDSPVYWQFSLQAYAAQGKRIEQRVAAQQQQATNDTTNDDQDDASAPAPHLNSNAADQEFSLPIDTTDPSDGKCDFGAHIGNGLSPVPADRDEQGSDSHLLSPVETAAAIASTSPSRRSPKSPLRSSSFTLNDSNLDITLYESSDDEGAAAQDDKSCEESHVYRYPFSVPLSYLVPYFNNSDIMEEVVWNPHYTDPLGDDFDFNWNKEMIKEINDKYPKRTPRRQYGQRNVPLGPLQDLVDVESKESTSANILAFINFWRAGSPQFQSDLMAHLKEKIYKRPTVDNSLLSGTAYEKEVTESKGKSTHQTVVASTADSADQLQRHLAESYSGSKLTKRPKRNVGEPAQSEAQLLDRTMRRLLVQRQLVNDKIIAAAKKAPNFKGRGSFHTFTVDITNVQEPPVGGGRNRQGVGKKNRARRKGWSFNVQASDDTVFQHVLGKKKLTAMRSGNNTLTINVGTYSKNAEKRKRPKKKCAESTKKRARIVSDKNLKEGGKKLYFEATEKVSR